MKINLTITITILSMLFFLPRLAFCQGNWEWAVSFGGTQNESGIDVSLHPNGNLYCVGYFSQGSFSINDSIVIDGYYSLSNSFLCKYDQSGNLVKITTARGDIIQPNPPEDDNSVDFGQLVLSENNENFYMLINVKKEVIIDTVHLNGERGLELFARWDTNARMTAYKTLGLVGSSSVDIPSISTTQIYNGSMYALGYYSGTYAYLDTIRLNNPDSLNFTSGKAFLAKLNTQGNFKFAKQAIGGSITELAFSKIVNGKMICYGESFDCFIFDTINTCSPMGHGVAVIFLSDTNGSVFWSQPVYSESNIYGISSFTMDDVGNVYISGSFDSVLHIGNNLFYRQNPSYYGKFMAKLNANGDLIRFEEIYRTDQMQLNFPANVKGNKFYVTGSFSGTIVMCGDTINAQSNRDMFIARFDTSGNCIGIITVPNASAADFVEDSLGNVYVIGFISGGNAVFGQATIASQGMTDFFLAKLSAITTGIGSKLSSQKDNHLTIYANPNSGSFTIIMPDGLRDASQVQLGIYDNTGKTVREEKLNVTDNKVAVTLETITKGIYTVTLSCDKKKFTGKVMVE